MRVVIIAILLLLSACTKGQTGILGVQVSPSVDYNVLVENGTFTPATASTADLATYRSYNLGWLLSWNLNQFYGYFPAVVSGSTITQTPPAPSYFTAYTPNIAAWADSAVAHGVDFVYFTIENEYGYLLYNSDVTPLSGQYHANYMTPTDTIVDRYVREFTSRGIRVGMYFNLEWNWNGVPSGGISTQSSGYKTEIYNYYALIAQEVMRKWPDIDMFWLDYGPAETTFRQKMYNAIKSINPNALVVGNGMGTTDFQHYPYDVQSTEEYFILTNGSTAYQTTSRTNGSTTYYVPQEGIFTPRSQFSEWYYVDDTCPLQPVVSPFDGSTPFVKDQYQSVSTSQGLVNSLRTYTCPVVANMIADRYGVLVPAALDHNRQINFNP